MMRRVSLVVTVMGIRIPRRTDITEQQAYKDGKKAREMTNNEEHTVEDVRKFINEKYGGYDRVNRDLFRKGWRTG